MPDCNHGEAHTRIVVHQRHTLLTKGTSTILVRTVDTDVVLILVGKFRDLKAVNVNVDIWVAFGMGRSFKYISIKKIFAALGE